MNKYSLQGFYNYNGRRGDLTGELDINSEGQFESIIMDHLSQFPNQTIRGHFRDTNALTKMIFFKFPPSHNLANLIYRLEKPKSFNLSGVYRGRWDALPYSLQMSDNMDLIIARTDTTVCNIGDYAEIILSKTAG
jgi:hypothetical protein